MVCWKEEGVESTSFRLPAAGLICGLKEKGEALVWNCDGDMFEVEQKCKQANFCGF